MGDFTHTKLLQAGWQNINKINLKYCRVCEERISRNRVTFSCQDHADKIAQTFGVLCSDDNPDLHPFICHGCYGVTTRSKKAMEDRQYHHSKVFSWTRHSPDGCALCEHFQKVSTGGRPKKKSELKRRMRWYRQVLCIT